MALFSLRKAGEKRYSKKEGASSAPKNDTSYMKGRTKAAKPVTAPTKAIVAKKISVPTVAIGTVSAAAGAILRPHVTEKAGILSQSGRYTFQISSSADKQSIAKAVKALYKVSPVRIALINMPSKTVFVRGKRGHVGGIRKAVVTLKKGETIDFV